jgi:serine/threonine protein kinase
MPQRRRRERLRPGARIGEFRIRRWLAGGGNADVYEAVRADKPVALKILRNRDGTSEPYRRFRQEAAQHKQLSDSEIPGVLPLLDFDVPRDPSDARPPWLAMPIARPIVRALGNEPELEEVVGAVADIADTLARLHADNIAHRDIKPDNLYRYRNAWVIGDFGLVSVPGGEPLTVGAKALGPRNFLAPEMTLQPTSADGRQADVYSLGKTLWCLITGLPTPPSGEHRRELEWKRLGAWGVAHPRAFYLDHLIEQMCTEIAAARPPMSSVASTLRGWARSPATAGTGEVPNVADIAGEIADVLDGDRRRLERDQARRAEIEALATRFAEQVSAFIQQLDTAGLPHTRLSAAHVGVSTALQGFADHLSAVDLVSAFRSIAVERNTGRDRLIRQSSSELPTP